MRVLIEEAGMPINLLVRCAIGLDLPIMMRIKVGHDQEADLMGKVPPYEVALYRQNHSFLTS